MRENEMDFWDFFWLLFWTYVFIAYLTVLFSIVVDIFRDHDMNGWAKAAWIIFLIFLPVLAAVIYIIWRGQGMGDRQEARAMRAQYGGAAPGPSSADEIAKAKALLDNGSITADEYAALKARALR
jgi:hypothetical protein